MAARFDKRAHPTTRTWAPRTEDLDTLSTSDIREDNTSDLSAVRTQDVDGAPAPERPTDARVFTPLVQPATQITSDLDSQPDASSTPPRERSRQSARPSEPHVPRSASASAAPPRPAPITSEHKPLAGVSPGAVLQDRYLIERALGAGGTAWVFRARDLSIHKDASAARVAIKTPRPDVKDPARAIARLQHEFKHVQGLAHPNIARVLELSSDDQTWFMTMELIEGRSLATLIREPASLPLPVRRAVLTSCAQALGYAHSKSIVHGDFKPSNVLVSPSGQVKVFDFGAATSPGGEETRIPAGTPAYASPQVLSGATPDPRDDVFSFACVAYELLTGRHPFDRSSSLEARDQGKVPARITTLQAPPWLALLSALAWERDERPSDIEKVAELLTSESTPPAPPRAERDSDSLVSAPPVVAPESIHTEINEEPAAPQRSWGFFAFVACAVGLVLIGTQRQSDKGVGADVGSAEPPAELQAAPTGLMGAPAIDGSLSDSTLSGTVLGLATSEGGLPAPNVDEPATEAPAEITPVQKRPRPPNSEISFESPHIATSESSLAAVVVIKRSEPLSHRVQIRWRAVSGTAEAGVDFASDAMGTVELLEGQTQRAIYVPLRNDLEKEGDETFSIELEVLRGGRIANGTATATILDDD